MVVTWFRAEDFPPLFETRDNAFVEIPAIDQVSEFTLDIAYQTGGAFWVGMVGWEVL